MTSLNRRRFLQGMTGCAGYLAAMKCFAPGVSWAAASCNSNNKVLVHVFLDGGMDSASLLIPRNIQSYMDKRPNIRITNPLVIDSKYGLHPSLTNIHNLVMQGRAAVINKVGYPSPTRSHEDSKNVYAKAVRAGTSVNTGWAGRFGDTYCQTNQNITSVMSFRGNVREIASQQFVATTAGSLGSYGYSNDNDQSDSIYRRSIIQTVRGQEPIANEQAANLQKAWNVIDGAVSELATINQTQNGVTYPNNGLAQRFRDAAKLIKSGANPSIILLSQGGYDTHGDELTALASNFGALNGAIGAFMNDLVNMGRQNDVVVQVFTEFGRNTFENSTQGTDHGAGTVALVIGPQVLAPVHGPDYTEADFGTKPWLDGAVDFREILSEAISRHLGVDPAPIFPEAYSTAGVHILA